MSYRYSTDSKDVDWTALKEALIKGDFCNGRTPDEYRRSAEGSFLNVYVYHGDEIVGNGRSSRMGSATRTSSMFGPPKSTDDEASPPRSCESSAKQSPASTFTSKPTTPKSSTASVALPITTSAWDGSRGLG